jgi:hypothetical protein
VRQSMVRTPGWVAAVGEPPRNDKQRGAWPSPGAHSPFPCSVWLVGFGAKSESHKILCHRCEGFGHLQAKHDDPAREQTIQRSTTQSRKFVFRIQTRVS